MSKWDSYLSETVTAPVLGSSGRHYPSVQTALSCLDWIESHGLVILGFDGLNAVALGIQPRLGHIADFSSIEGHWDARWRHPSPQAEIYLPSGSDTSSSSISPSSNAKKTREVREQDRELLDC